MATVGCIYYSDNSIDNTDIVNICRKQLADSFSGEIISVTFKPVDLGKNMVVGNLARGYPTMVHQILLALENSTAEYVYFTEHDVLYNPSHFKFIPPADNIFYYNSNCWRWDYPNDRAITYDRLISLSGLCANRNCLLNHYRARMQIIAKNNWGGDNGHEAGWIRRMGYEPGTKKKKRGGYFDDDYDVWQSECPIIDIRHKKTFSPSKVTLESFKHLPNNWKEIKASEIPGWNLGNLFGLWN